MSTTSTQPAWVSALLSKDLSPVERIVLAYLAWRQGSNGSSWPSQATIAADLGLSCEGVRKITQRLEAKGCLSVTWTGPGRGKDHRKQYHVTPPTKTPTAVRDLGVENPNGGLAFAIGENPNGGTNKTPTAKPRHKKKNTTGTQQGKKRKKFTPPTPQEVNDYAESLGYTNFHKGETFVNTYAPRGWRDTKGRPVKDWQSKLRAVWLKDLKKPERGDPDWLPTEAELEAIYAQC